ncbi:hypothetical protein N2L37_001386 [Vibrio cholerae]|nr:hypothetical protein [Vibrio cholerae]EJL6418228.1 hypothetical protein [Vibrio cholerae]EJT3082277.1 hypothetical protein [Vibrio cholerae]EJT3330984.1 hypothetical protein [Vibrio cholerae]EJT3392333.1 hypothetical protein [Vibrio cholerae]
MVDQQPLWVRRVLVSRERYAPYFDGLTQYAVLDKPIVFSGDFDISIEAEGLRNDSFQALFSGETVDNFFRLLQGGSGIQCYIGGAIVSWLTNQFDASQPHHYRLKRVGSVASIGVDGEWKVSREGIQTPLTVTRMMRSWTTSLFTRGQIRELIIQGAVYPLDQKESAIQRSQPDNGNALTIINHTKAMWRRV